jgi:hypothetical protein
MSTLIKSDSKAFPSLYFSYPADILLECTNYEYALVT